MNIVIILSIVLVIFVLAILLFVLIGRSKLKTSQEGTSNKLLGVIKRYPEIKKLAIEALQNGATHFQYIGPAIFFYRTYQGKAESCFAEYSPSEGRFSWIVKPAKWQDAKQIQDDAVPMPNSL